LYLLTEERWFPGTLIRVTLSKAVESEPGAGRSITVHAKVVRSDTDGVGLGFVLADPPKRRRGSQPISTALTANNSCSS